MVAKEIQLSVSWSFCLISRCGILFVAPGGSGCSKTMSRRSVFVASDEKHYKMVAKGMKYIFYS